MGEARTSGIGIVTDCAHSRAMAVDAAQARLRELWDTPGLAGFCFSEVSETERALRDRNREWFSLVSGDAIGCKSATFRRVASSLLRGHFLAVARAFSLWHVLTLLVSAPS